MKEIVYIQAGQLSNYTGTHFWNAQESYLQSAESQGGDIEPGISFCESVDAQNRATLCPRVLMLDRKSNFGSLGSSNALGAMVDDEPVTAPAPWGGNIIEYKQDRIPKSIYHTILEDSECQSQKSPDEDQNNGRGDIRYWSDFSRVYYLPKSIQKIPDPPDWETTNDDRNKGQETFTRLNEETELMDGTLRLFVEDCDNIQGVQIMNDTDTFGSFMSSFLASFRDEYLKLSSISFPVMSGVGLSSSDLDEPKRIRQLVNEALHLRTLNEFSSINIPIKDPTLWNNSVWGPPLNFPSTSLYHQSAVLSAHVETCTLPFRMRRGQNDIPTACARLNWRGTSPFAELGGVFPVTPSSNLEDAVINFSSDFPANPSNLYCRWDVSRGFPPKRIVEYEKWLTRKPSSANGSYFTTSSVHASAYPLPDSFPEFNDNDAAEKSHQTKNTPGSIELYSSLSSSSNVAQIFEKYALFIENCAKRRSTATASIDISVDDLKDLTNDLWTIHDNSSGESGAFSM